MKIFGYEIKLRKRQYPGYYAGSGLWHTVLNTIQEPFTGAWQRNITYEQHNLLSFSAVYSCVTGISADIAKLRIKLCENQDGILVELTENQPWLPLLRKPNHYQTRQQFLEMWMVSKLVNGNSYIVKQRDRRDVVNALYVLDPCKVKILIATSGDVFYEIGRDDLNRIHDENIVLPASEVIHDRATPIFPAHPLLGVSPLYACSSAILGRAIQNNSETFFNNRSLPGGMLTAPDFINDETASRLKREFEKNFKGTNLGRLFVAGNGLKFEPITMTAEEADLVEQLKWAVSDVARAFHYPEFKLTGQVPPYAGSAEALTLTYYTDCIQQHIESIEALLDEGLELPLGTHTQLDIFDLMRMDTKSLFESNNLGVSGGWMKPNEARRRAQYQPVSGGDTPYMQQQNYSLAALNSRKQAPDKLEPAPTQQALPAAQEPEETEEREISVAELLIRTQLSERSLI